MQELKFLSYNFDLFLKKISQFKESFDIYLLTQLYKYIQIPIIKKFKDCFRD